MLDERIEEFAAHGRLIDAVLGLLFLTAQVEAVSSRGRRDGGTIAGGPLVDVFLGLISVGRSLRGSIACSAMLPPVLAAAAATPDQTTTDRIMR